MQRSLLTPAWDALAFPGGLELPNVCGFYENFLTDPALPASDYHFVSYVYGDLNAANILVDGHDNVWVIDSPTPARVMC